VAVAVLNGIAFAVFGIAHLPLLGRYLFVGATMLALLAAVGALGWTSLPPDHPGRRPRTAFGVAALAAIVVLFPLQQVDRLNKLKDDIAARDVVQADLHNVLRGPLHAFIHRCVKVRVLSHRPVPLVSYWADKRPETVVVSTHSPARSCTILPANERVAHLAILDPKEPETAPLPQPGRRSVTQGSWTVVLRR
jgi:hypothetical protein